MAVASTLQKVRQMNKKNLNSFLIIGAAVLFCIYLGAVLA
jgi:hypothetical protein